MKKASWAPAHRRIAAPGATIFLLAFANIAFAQSYPAKPVKIIVAFTALVKSEIAKWSKVARDSGAKAD